MKTARESKAKQPEIDGGRGQQENLLLLALPAADRARVVARLRPARLDFGLTIYEANQPISDLYFPTDAVISMVSDMEEGTVEVGTVGREGMSGLPVLLRAKTMPTRAYVQVRGYGYRLPATELVDLRQESPSIERLLYQYSQAL